MSETINLREAIERNQSGANPEYKIILDALSESANQLALAKEAIERNGDSLFMPLVSSVIRNHRELVNLMSLGCESVNMANKLRANQANH